MLELFIVLWMVFGVGNWFALLLDQGVSELGFIADLIIGIPLCLLAGPIPLFIKR